MIQNLRPRVLNKSTTPSVIKSTEMLDAVNIVADGIDSSDSNTIKKISGNIKSYLLDGYDGFNNHQDIVNLIGDDVVIGSVADEGRQRLFYFTHGELSGVNFGSVYMMEQFSEDEILIVLVCRSTRFNFLSEDFVASNILRVPRSEVSYAEDLDFSGVLDDTIDGVDQFSDGNVAGELQVDYCPTSLENQVLSPTPGSQSQFNFNTSITNIGDLLYQGATFTFGFNTPDDPQSPPGITIESVDPGFSNGSTFVVLGGETIFITLSVSTENDTVVGGTYPLWFQILDPNGAPLHVCEWTLDLVSLTAVTPIYRISLQTSNGGTGASNTALLDASSSIILSELNTNGVLGPGDPELVSLDIVIARDNPQSAQTGEYFPARAFSVNLSNAAVDYFDLVINPDDNVSQLNGNSFIAEFPDAFQNGIDKCSFSLRLRTDVQDYPPAGSTLPFINTAILLNIAGGDISLTGSNGGNTFSVGISIDHRLPVAAGTGAPNITITGGPASLNLPANNPEDPNFNGGINGATFTITNTGNAGGYYILDASPDEPSVTNQGKGAILSMGTTFDISNSNAPITPIVSTVVTDADPTIVVTGDLNDNSYLRFLGPNSSEDVVIRMQNEDSQFESAPVTIIGDPPGPGEYWEMGSPLTDGSVTVSCRAFDASFGGSGVNYVNLAQTPISSSVQVNYDITAAGAQGELIIKPSLNAQLISRPNSIIAVNGNDNSLQKHMFGTSLGLTTGAASLGDSNVYLRAFYNPTQSFRFLSDPIVDQLDSGQQGFLGTPGSPILPGGMDIWGGGIDLLNTTQDTNASDALVTITVNTPQTVSPLYTGALPHSLQGHVTAGFPLHDPPASQPTFGAQGSIGYIVFYTEPISLVGGHNPEFFQDSNEFYKTEFNSSLVYTTGSPYQTKHGGYRKASISVPPNTWVKVAIFPVWTVGAFDDVEQDINTLDEFGFSATPLNFDNSPIAAQINVNIAGPVTNPDTDINGNLKGQIVHLNSSDPTQYELFDFVADQFGPALRPSGPSRREVQPIDTSSLPLSNGSSTSSLQFETSNEPRSGSLSVRPTTSERVRLKSSGKKAKKKTTYGNR